MNNKSMMDDILNMLVTTTINREENKEIDVASLKPVIIRNIKLVSGPAISDNDEGCFVEMAKIDLNHFNDIIVNSIIGDETISIKTVSKLQMSILLAGDGIYQLDNSRNDPMQQCFFTDELSDVKENESYLGIQIDSDDHNRAVNILSNINNIYETYVRITHENNRWSKWFLWEPEMLLPIDVYKLTKQLYKCLNNK